MYILRSETTGLYWDNDEQDWSDLEYATAFTDLNVPHNPWEASVERVELESLLAVGLSNLLDAAMRCSALPAKLGSGELAETAGYDSATTQYLIKLADVYKRHTSDVAIEAPIAKKKYKVLIELDDSPEDPSGPEGSGWSFHSFCTRHSNFKHPSAYFTKSKNPRRNISVKLQQGLAFQLSYHEHGVGLWYLAGGAPACQFDTVQWAGIAIWSQPIDNLGAKTPECRATDCDISLREYNDWCNGYCYTVIVEDEEGSTVDIASIIGTDGLVYTIRGLLPKDAGEDNVTFGDEFGLLDSSDRQALFAKES